MHVGEKTRELALSKNVLIVEEMLVFTRVLSKGYTRGMFSSRSA